MTVFRSAPRDWRLRPRAQPCDGAPADERHAETVTPDGAGGGALEVWGGVECTVSRVRDGYVDQLELTGHARRDSDVDLIASLGVRAVRYPVLWERVAPHGLETASWSWSDARLDRLRAHGVTPILGLVHHGSGPRDTSLLDPMFPMKLAAYARAVAERYPWLEWVTPVNEPLTTARFSGLYGHWYPHACSDRAFVRALLHECFAVRAAMHAIREIAPHAKLVQTEDLAHIHAVPALEYQAEFENHRRWLTWDLLTGRVDRTHPLYAYLTRAGAMERELASLRNDPCPPDIIGVDYYVTSERYLDDAVDAYPSHCHGGNGWHRYVDAEVARVCPEQRRGAAALITETWERYHIPIAITEAFLSCDDCAERVRWFAELWSAALAARDAGCDVRAVTAWALFGVHGWNELATHTRGRYDAGAFDVRDGVAHETPLAATIRAFARHGWCDAPAIDAPGWWHPERACDHALATSEFSNPQ